jgi:hypothetical protein
MRHALRPNFDETRHKLAERFLLMLSICLAGYALAGRGFAYMGVPPLFISEVCLLVGLAAWLITRGWSPVFNMGPAMAVVPLVALGVVRLATCIRYYRIEAVRDAVVWGYAAFALVVATLIVAQPERLKVMLDRYRLFSKIFLIGIPIAFVIYRFGREALPAWPGGTPIIQVKEGDALVHLGGILAFWMAEPKRKVRWIWAVLLTFDLAILGVVDRAGVVAFFAVMIICLIAKPLHGAAWRTIGLLLLAVLLLWVSAIKIEVPGGKGRDISWQQFQTNIVSIFSDTREEGLDSNKQWRIDWWNDIIDYTFNGQYFWTGKGFGINLADDDGFQVAADHSLRSPHSVHMTMLARMGVPGAAAWLLMNMTWLYCVGSMYLRTRRRRDQNWAGVFLFLFAYYAAFMINGSFDVFIEGPMGGVWFWTIYGVGVAALWTYRYRPYVLADEVIDERASRAQLLPAAGWGGSSLPLGAGVARVPRA